MRSYNRRHSKEALLLGIAFFTGVFVFSQDKSPVIAGRVSPSDFNLPSSSIIDSNSNAIIIADIGSTGFTGNKNGWISYVHKRHTRIRILKKTAFDAAVVKVVLYHDNENIDKEVLDNIEGTTYNMENGRIVETRLDKKDVFEETLNKNHNRKKFTMPAVKEGSIIDYSYTITSDFYSNLPEWDFQNIEYPCLWSEYEVSIPTLVGYTIARQGSHPFYINKSGNAHESYKVKEGSDMESSALAQTQREYVINAVTNTHRWVIKDLPAFTARKYIFTPFNYIDKIEFQLSQLYNGETARDVRNNWKKATQELLEDKDFGQSIQPDYLSLPADLEKIAVNETNLQEKARKIYYFVQDNITCTDHYNIYLKTTLADVYKKRSGNTGEVNLLLIALLRKNGIHADPVLLSTREYGYNFSSYPIMERFNYVIARVELIGRIYMLDASKPLLGFGRLAENCYNGHARIICATDSGSVYFSPDSIKEQKNTIIFMVNGEKKDGAMEGSCQSDIGYLSSLKLREKVKEEGMKGFFKTIQAAFGPDLQMMNAGIDSLQQTEYPVKIHYDFNFKSGAGEDIIYFNPVITDMYKENPFEAAHREYPVEMSYPTDETYTLNMEIPAGYQVDELPKSARMTLNEKDGFFEYMIQHDDANIQLHTHIKLNKATFDADDYNTLRDFFAYVVKKQSEQIVFKKKK